MLDLTEDNVATALGVLQEQGLVPRLPVPAEHFADAEMREAGRPQDLADIAALERLRKEQEP